MDRGGDGYTEDLADRAKEVAGRDGHADLRLVDRGDERGCQQGGRSAISISETVEETPTQQRRDDSSTTQCSESHLHPEFGLAGMSPPEENDAEPLEDWDDGHDDTESLVALVFLGLRAIGEYHASIDC